MFHEFIFCIFACDTIKRYKDEIHKIEETWGKEAEGFGSGFGSGSGSGKLLFFLGEHGPLVGDNYIHLENVGDDYLSAADKQYLGIKYVYEHYDFRYLYVCGTDTFVLVKNLTEFMRSQQFNEDDAIIIGGHGDTRTICDTHVHFFSGGAGFILTKKTVELLHPRLALMQSEWLDLCVANNYITYIPACDVSICYFLKSLNARFVNVQNRFFNCNYIGYNNTPTGLYKCCTQTVDTKTMIACHNMSPSDFDYLNKLIA